MPSAERAPQEKETLLYDNPESAATFREQVEQRVQQEQHPGVDPSREVVGEAIAQAFEKEGEVPHTLSQPWEHTEGEHAEVQELVDTTFEKDLKAAISKARASASYPRNIDLFHDVLTGEVYDVLKEHRVMKQRVMGSGIAAVIVALVVLVGIILVFVFFGS